MAAVNSEQRFNRHRRCPVCGGCDQDPRGEGQRCHGFLSDDGAWAHCSRAEHAGGLEEHPESGTYAHRLTGDCRCGVRHDPRPASSNGNGRQPARDIVATYDYCDSVGDLVYQVVRLNPKGFRQRRPDAKGGWIWNLKGVWRVLYRLPELLAADPDQPVFIVEGEKDVDRLASLGLVATTNPMGTGKWLESYAEPLKGRAVVVIPDNDPPNPAKPAEHLKGQCHAQAVARSLHGRSKSVKYLELPGLPDKGDVSDWLDTDPGRGAAELLALAETTPEWEPPRGGQDTAPSLTITTLRDIEAQGVEWLWPKRIPQGKLAIIAGDPGLGKSYLTLDVAARVSLGGPWPDGGHAPLRDVLLVSAEDGVSDTIRPRLDLLGANVSRVHAISPSVGDRALSIAEHLVALENAIVERKAVLLVLDPLLAFTGRRTDTHRSSDVRAVLAPLAAMADRTGCAILGVFHLNKRSGEVSSLYRITASLDFAAAARSVMVVGKDPNDPNRRVLAPVKSNLSAPAVSLAFHFTPDGCFAWDGVVDLDADAILAAPTPGEQSEMEEAKHFLVSALSAGEVESRAIRAEAREMGISERTLKRAKAVLGVESVRRGQPGKRGGGGWFWRLPDPDLEGQTPCDTGGPLNQEMGGLGGQPPIKGANNNPFVSYEMDLGGQGGHTGDGGPLNPSGEGNGSEGGPLNPEPDREVFEV